MMEKKRRLIDANELLQNQYTIIEMGDPEELFSQDAIHEVVSVESVKTAPTVDAVEVVRCQSCVYGMKIWGNNYRCALTGASWLHPKAYCAYGERKSDGS